MTTKTTKARKTAGKATKVTKAKTTKAKAAPKRAKAGSESKRAICAALLTRSQGATTRDLLDATGWPAISVPAVAKASGLKLRMEKEGRTTTYFGTEAA